MVMADKLSGRTTLFDDAPGPSPWFLSPRTRTVRDFRWQSAGDTSLTSGKTLLLGSNGPVALLDFYNYTMVLDESSLLVWHQGWNEAAPTPPVRLLVIRPHLLSPLGDDLDSVYQQMKDARTPIVIGGRASEELTLGTVNAGDELEAKFPKPLQALDELLILCRSSGINSQQTSEGMNLALLVARPSELAYKLYPQDWFNSGDLDYGYQWVTRVVRNPRTKQIHGEGIRIAPFVLDDSLRRLRQSE